MNTGFKSRVEARRGKSLKAVLLDFKASGHSCMEVAEELQCTLPTIYKYCKHYKIKLNTERAASVWTKKVTRPSLDILSAKWM